MARLPTFQATPVRLLPLVDFTGGLNLRGDAFQVQPNETPDCLDVDLQIGGGFVQRRVATPFANALATAPLGLWAFEGNSFSQVIAQTGNTLHQSTGGNWSAISGTLGASSRARAAEFADSLYFTQGGATGRRWDGTTLHTLGVSYNETIGGEGANDGNMPEARYICSHMGRMFIAYTTESGTDFPCRIRWSHADFPEDWRQEDFIDIDIDRDGDVITGIVEFRDKLYIFKNNSIYILSGYGPQNFQVVPLAQEIGACSQESIVLTEVGLFFFSWPQGVYLDKGTGPYPIFDKVYPLTRDGFIPAAFRDQIACGYVNKMLWCSVPYGSSEVNARTYVYNPWIFKNRYLRFLQGPWYPYSLGISAFLRWDQTSSDTAFLAAMSSLTYVAQLDQTGATDNFGAGAVNLNSYYRSSWFSAGAEGVVKRWRHPDLIATAASGGAINVEVFHDYSESDVYRTFQAQATVTAEGMLWDVGAPVVTVTNTGTPGSTTYSYVVTALVGTDESEGVEVTTTTGNATLNSTNFNHLVWPMLATATSYNVYGRTTGSEVLITNVAVGHYNDEGATLGTQVPPVLSFGGMWDDGSGTDGGGQWAGIPAAGEQIIKGASMGSAQAVQMLFSGTPGLSWGIDGITLKFIPKRIRA